MFDAGEDASEVVRAALLVDPGAMSIAALSEVDGSALSDSAHVQLASAWAAQGAWLAAQSARAHHGVLTAYRKLIGECDLSRTSTEEEARRGAAHELAAALGRGPRSSYQLLDHAEVLCVEHPTLLAALEAGVVDDYGARIVLRYVLPLEASAQVQALADVLTLLYAVHAARREAARTGEPGPAALTPRRLHVLSARAATAADPAAASERARRAKRERRVEVTPLEDAMIRIGLVLPVEDARAVVETLDRATAVKHTADPRGRDARRADALVRLITGFPASCEPDLDECTAPAEWDAGEQKAAQASAGAAGDQADAESDSDQADAQSAGCGPGGVPPNGQANAQAADEAHACPADSQAPAPVRQANSSETSEVPVGVGARAALAAAGDGAATAVGMCTHPSRVELQIQVSLEALLGLRDDPAHLVGYGPLPASVARGFIDDAALRRPVHDPLTGHLLDRTPQTYRPTAALRGFVLSRDQTGTFPGCDREARAADLDHAWEFPAGPTQRHNLHPLCEPHHLTKHLAPDRGGWALCGPLLVSPDWIERPLIRDFPPPQQRRWTSPMGCGYTSEPSDHRPARAGPPADHHDIPF